MGEMPRIARGPEGHRLRDGFQAQLGRIGLAENHQPRLFPALHDVVRLRRRDPGQTGVALAGRHARQIHAQILEQKGHASKSAVQWRRIPQLRRSALAQVLDDGIDLRVDRIATVQRRLQSLGRAQLTTLDARGNFQCVIKRTACIGGWRFKAPATPPNAS